MSCLPTKLSEQYNFFDHYSCERVYTISLPPRSHNSCSLIYIHRSRVPPATICILRGAPQHCPSKPAHPASPPAISHHARQSLSMMLDTGTTVGIIGLIIAVPPVVFGLLQYRSSSRRRSNDSGPELRRGAYKMLYTYELLRTMSEQSTTHDPRY